MHMFEVDRCKFYKYVFVTTCLCKYIRLRLYYRDIKDENVNLINVNVDVITTFQTFCFVTFKIDLLLEFEVVERGNR